MSDYFGALMQSSGLSVDGKTALRLDTARQVTLSPVDDGIVEVDEQVSVAHNDLSVNRNMPFDPVQSRTDAETQDGAVGLKVGVTPIPSVVEQARPATTAPMDVPMVEAQTAHSYVGDRPVIDEAPPRTTEPIQVQSIERLPAGTAMVQAALRWVAFGESHAPAAPEPEAVSMRQVDSSVMPKEVQASDRSEPLMSKFASKERLESFPSSLPGPPGPPQGAEDPVTLYDSVPHRRVQAHDPESESVVEVTIGSINVRVDGPPPPVGAAMAPPPTDRTVPESPPRSGLSRRTLWRI